MVTFVRIICSAIICFLSASSCYAAGLTITQGAIKHVFSSAELAKLLHQNQIEVEDPVYHKHKHYAGYWLSDIFNLAGIKPGPDKVLVFTALDGYKARITVSEVNMSEAQAFVAVKDLDAPQGWEPIHQGKQTLSPGPFYLVWQIPSGAPSDSKLPWPYQMAKISVLGLNHAQDKLFPEAEDRGEAEERGFKIFQQNCIACHSINLEGGTLGPELNVPKNILEYENRSFIKAFIKDPSSFRAKSKMPAFNKTLSDPSIEDLLDYLAWMSKHKIE